MLRITLTLSILLALVVVGHTCLNFQPTLLFGTRAEAFASQADWAVQVEEGKTARSTLSIGNRCSAPHRFRVESKAKFLRFERPTESILIGAGVVERLGVQFDATALKSKVYRGKVVIDCLDCKEEARCSQDRDELEVEMTVIKPSAAAATVPHPHPTIQPAPTPQPTPQPTPPLTSSKDFSSGSVNTIALQDNAVTQGWTINIDRDPTSTACGKLTNIPVAGATDCPSATAVAWNLLTTLVQNNCLKTGCPADYVITQGVPKCKPEPYKRPNGSDGMRWRVSWTWNCVKPPSIQCCECLGQATTLDLSTGQSSPADTLWTVNGGTVYTTTPVAGWLTLPPAGWIQPVASQTPSVNIPAGLYTYIARFNVPKCTIPFSEVRLDGQFAADNSAQLFFDSVSVPGASCAGPTCFKSPQAPVSFSITNITPGTHTLEVRVRNDEVYSGLLLKAQLTAQCRKEATLP
ncbi:MAG TPA: hypothetical protein VGV59_09975 [Pyrinomonadaceae bacterium]|nr:hypothetical protein [Pyrinomonadaceae bacterium]